MTDDELKAKFAEYDAKLAKQSTVVDELLLWLKGSVKSWTNWFGVALIAAPDLIPQIAPNLQELLSPQHYKAAMQWVGILVILLRFKTTQSVKAKATGGTV